ncbi:hypothetical protein FBUS_10420 [Fasciolopsis buskii]|uniref:Uncharacterized protein n=1 Tax=Fasciolopsis buskii TaxID=27845 RepID=A0A8E0S3G1_9TREM|nr:hypothetical protein FBUS_10420 [Fasciolopsis buski]
MCESARDEMAASCISSLTSNVVTGAINTPIDCACATCTSVSSISSIPFTNASPTRLSISASADSTAVNFPGPLTTTTNVAARTPLDRPVPRHKRVPLASFNPSLVSYPTDSGSQVAAELIASTPSTCSPENYSVCSHR